MFYNAKAHNIPKRYSIHESQYFEQQNTAEYCNTATQYFEQQNVKQKLKYKNWAKPQLQ